MTYNNMTESLLLLLYFVLATGVAIIFYLGFCDYDIYVYKDHLLLKSILFKKKINISQLSIGSLGSFWTGGYHFYLLKTHNGSYRFRYVNTDIINKRTGINFGIMEDELKTVKKELIKAITLSSV